VFVRLLFTQCIQFILKRHACSVFVVTAIFSICMLWIYHYTKLFFKRNLIICWDERSYNSTTNISKNKCKCFIKGPFLNTRKLTDKSIRLEAIEGFFWCLSKPSLSKPSWLIWNIFWISKHWLFGSRVVPVHSPQSLSTSYISHTEWLWKGKSDCSQRSLAC